MKIKPVSALYKEFRLPTHIAAHCEAVAYVATAIVNKIKTISANEKDLIKRAALLHDLMRVCDIKNFNPQDWTPKPSQADIVFWQDFRNKHHGKHHADVGADFFYQAGECQVGDIIYKHYFTAILEDSRKPTTLAEKIVFYADKRVAHTNIVSLAERFREGAQRHHVNSADIPPHILAAQLATFNVEAELKSLAGITINDDFISS